MWWPLATLLLYAVLFAAQGRAQQSPEGLFLELIDLEGDPDKQLGLMDLFVKQFPQYSGMGAIYADMQYNCVKLELWDRALETGDKLLQIDRDDLRAVELNLEAAKGKKDATLIAKWTDRLAQLNEEREAVAAGSAANSYWRGKGLAGDMPKDPRAMIERNAKARQEAMLFNRAISEADPAVRLQALSQFVQDYPESPHLNKVNYLYYLAYREMKDEKNAMAMAEQILARDQSHEDVLLYVAESLFQRKRDLPKVVAYSQKILNLVKRPKPDDRQEEEWNRQRGILSTQAHWMLGMIALGANQFGAANQELRAALAMGAFADQIRPALLTNLGWANYNLKNIQDAIRFYQECASISSPYQKAAEQSLKSIKGEYGLDR